MSSQAPPETPPIRRVIAVGEIALFVSDRGRHRFPAKVEAGGELHTHKGKVAHDDIIGRPWGCPVHSHLGERYVVLRPSLEEVLVTTPRKTQIVFPKDIGYILLKLSITPGTRVIEAGSGSGALTTAFATYVTASGQVYSYEAKDRHQEVARRNIDRLGLDEAVTFHLRDIADGFVERDVDALFLDVREPQDFLSAAWDALAPGGFFGTLVPTINQVVAVTAGLAELPFIDVEIAELLLRPLRAIPDRIRPDDRLTAHTGYLLFARRMAGPEEQAAADTEQINDEPVDRGQDPTVDVEPQIGAAIADEAR